MGWDEIAGFLQDGNDQNRNAANAGDGPKHIAWLTFIDVLKDDLKTVLETHSGGGLYRVPIDAFCVGLPDVSILGHHQQCASLPAVEQATTYYSASGDQALGHMPKGCRYIAFDKCEATAKRLAAVARWRDRENDLDCRSCSYAGNGDSATGLHSLLKTLENTVLVMVDPFDLTDLERASGELRGIHHLRAILFGVTNQYRGTSDSRRGWDCIINSFHNRYMITWEWTGNANRNDKSQHLFFLWVVTPNYCEYMQMLRRLRAEHEILVRYRAPSHGYASEGPQHLTPVA